MSLFKKETSKLLSRSGLVLVCRVSGAAIAFATQILMARWMGATELGIYVYAFSLAMLLSTVAGLGFPAASLRFISQYLESNKTASINGFLRKGRLVLLLSSLLVSLVAFMVLTSVSGTSQYYTPVLLSIACIPFVTAFRFHDRVAHVFSWFTLSFLPSMTLRPLFFLVALFIVWKLGGNLSADIAMAVQFVVIVVIMAGQYFLLRPRLKQAINDTRVEHDLVLWLRSSLPLLVVTVFTQYFPELTVILISKDLPPDQIAIYNASFRTALLIGFVYNSVSAAIVPKASQLYAQGDVAGLQRYITHATQLNFAVSLFGFVFFLLAGEMFLGLFGEEFVAGYPVLLILAVSQLFIASVGPVTILLNITGHQNQCLYVFGAAIVLTVLLEHLLLPDTGLIGAAIMVLLVVIFWALWLHQLVVRYLGIRPSILSFIAARR